MRREGVAEGGGDGFDWHIGGLFLPLWVMVLVLVVSEWVSK